MRIFGITLQAIGYICAILCLRIFADVIPILVDSINTGRFSSNIMVFLGMLTLLAVSILLVILGRKMSKSKLGNRN